MSDDPTRDMLTPVLRATESVVGAYCSIKANPVKLRRLMTDFPSLAVELADLVEIWGEDEESVKGNA